jgi:pimeloyl-ACP methyl ester carboxylesterase
MTLQMSLVTSTWRIGLALVATAVAISDAMAAEAVSSRAPTRTVESSDGIRIAYDVNGQGATALVFVHGWSCDRAYWREQVEPFARQFTVVTVDLAGHGESGAGRKAWTIEAFGDDVAAVVRDLGLKRVLLIGHSMGGDVIVEAARQLPGRVAGLVWVDTYKQLGTARTPEQIQAFAAPFRANFADTTREFARRMFPPTADRALVERVAADMSAAPPEVALGAMVSAIGFERRIPGALAELKLPVIAINPEEPPTDMTSMGRYGVGVVLMARVGHFPMLEDPERFNSILKTAVDTVPR